MQADFNTRLHCRPRLLNWAAAVKLFTFIIAYNYIQLFGHFTNKVTHLSTFKVKNVKTKAQSIV